MGSFLGKKSLFDPKDPWILTIKCFKGGIHL